MAVFPYTSLTLFTLKCAPHLQLHGEINGLTYKSLTQVELFPPTKHAARFFKDCHNAILNE